MKSVISITALAGALAIAVPAAATVPGVESAGRGAVIKCGVTPEGTTVYAVHADKIVFQLTGGLQPIDPADQNALNAIPRGTPLDIKVFDNPKRVADLKGKVLSFLGAVDNANSREVVAIGEVTYAMVCPTTLAGF